jgi:carbon storage regulator CsrA
MLVLSRRLNEKLLFPGLHTSIQVVSIKPGMVRLGIEAPDDVRVLREEVPDRTAHWGLSPEEESNPGLNLTRLNQMLTRRLEIVRKGLSEVQEMNVEQPADASRMLARVDEDIKLLLHRVKTEIDKIAPAVRANVDEEEEMICAGATAILRSR